MQLTISMHTKYRLSTTSTKIGCLFFISKSISSATNFGFDCKLFDLSSPSGILCLARSASTIPSIFFNSSIPSAARVK